MISRQVAPGSQGGGDKTVFDVDGQSYALCTLDAFFSDQGGFFAVVKEKRRETVLSHDEAIKAVIRENFPPVEV